MARYQHVVTGARVEVRDDKVLDSSWKSIDEDAPKAAPRRSTKKAAEKPSDDSK